MLHLFYQTVNLKKKLKSQITSAIESEYLEELRDRTTNTFQDDIPHIFTFLFNNYGNVRPDDPKAEEKSILDMTLTAFDPLTKLFCRIEDLNELAIAAQSPNTQQQLINLGLDVIINTNDYTRALEEWFGLPGAQTWLQFKTHFTTAQRTIRKVRNATKRNTLFHSANQLSIDMQGVQDKINGLEKVQRTVLGSIDENCQVMA